MDSNKSQSHGFKLSQALTHFDFLTTQCDSSLFTKFHGFSILFVLVYVDEYNHYWYLLF